MFDQLNSIRFKLLRNELTIIFFSLFIVAFILLFVYSVIEPDWLTRESILLSLSLVAVVMTPIGMYLIFKISKSLKRRLDIYGYFLTNLSEGKYGSEIMYFEENDELDMIGRELNKLAVKLQDQVKSLQKLADEKSEFAQQAHIAATIEERQRLARDLHDAVSQQLFALTMMSQATVKTIEHSPKDAVGNIKEIASIALQAQNEMRALLLHLRPIQLSGATLDKGIQELIDELSGKSNISFDVDIDELSELSPSTEEHLFRMMQEALSNILRHANASKVTLIIKEKENSIDVHISDNGVGFDLDSQTKMKTSYGLKTMQERCEEIGGTFKIRSKPGQGTYIDVRIPR